MMWLVTTMLPGLNLLPATRYSGCLLFAVAGTLISLAGVMAFRIANTTVNPRQPGKTSSLVTSGIYRFTRNPMYVGFTCWLIAWSVLLANLYALPLVIGFIVYIDHYQIKPEEKILEGIFGDEFLDYKNRVRRWL